jgi:hypothetical protein
MLPIPMRFPQHRKEKIGEKQQESSELFLRRKFQNVWRIILFIGRINHDFGNNYSLWLGRIRFLYRGLARRWSGYDAASAPVLPER